MTAKRKQVAKKAPLKKAPARKAAAKKVTGKRRAGGTSSGMVATSATAAATSTCGDNCESTQPQAIAYMNNEILWSTIFTKAWQDAALFQQLVDNADNANALLQQLAQQFNIPVNIPEGITTKIVFDTPTVVHLLMPAVQNIPPRSVDMVPHAL